jgi:putative sterol carrier protein
MGAGCHGDPAFARHNAAQCPNGTTSPCSHEALQTPYRVAHFTSQGTFREENMDIATLTAGMKERIEAKPAFGNTVKFDFGDDGKIHIDGKNGNTVTNDDGAADCTLKVTLSDFVDMVEGRLNGMNAFMSGKLKVEGDMSIAMKLQTIIS